MINEVIQGDCLEVMKDIPDNSIDTIITDPPYNLSTIFLNMIICKICHKNKTDSTSGICWECFSKWFKW